MEELTDEEKKRFAGVVEFYTSIAADEPEDFTEFDKDTAVIKKAFRVLGITTKIDGLEVE